MSVEETIISVILIIVAAALIPVAIYMLVETIKHAIHITKSEKMLREKLFDMIAKVPSKNKYEVIFNKSATILFVDGKKYISKAHNENFDSEKGLLMCLAKANGISYLELKRMIKGAKWQALAPKERKSINGVSVDRYKAYRELCGSRPFSDDYKPIYTPLKKKRGRPRKAKEEVEEKVKRPVGRPRKINVGDNVKIIQSEDERYIGKKGLVVNTSPFDEVYLIRLNGMDLVQANRIEIELVEE